MGHSVGTKLWKMVKNVIVVLLTTSVKNSVVTLDKLVRRTKCRIPMHRGVKGSPTLSAVLVKGLVVTNLAILNKKHAYSVNKTLSAVTLHTAMGQVHSALLLILVQTLRPVTTEHR